MARRHLTRKEHLGLELDAKSVAISRQLARVAAMATGTGKSVFEAASDQAEMAALPAASGVPEASHLEDLAIYQGADVLFAKDKEGPITALAIILIPEENRQNRRVAALAANFGFVAHLSRKRRVAVAVPEGYVTDFASIPGFAHWLISPFGKHAEAAVVHDWLYTLGKPKDGKARKQADKVFRRALKLVGVGFLRRNIMYYAVRIGGGSGFGLETDYDFRDLVELKRRKPLPDRTSFAFTWTEGDIPPKPKKNRGKVQPTVRSAPPPAPAPQSGAPEAVAAPPAMAQEQAKQEVQESLVATEQR
jgi:hypothetical protein